MLCFFEGLLCDGLYAIQLLRQAPAFSRRMGWPYTNPCVFESSQARSSTDARFCGLPGIGRSGQGPAALGQKPKQTKQKLKCTQWASRWPESVSRRESDSLATEKRKQRQRGTGRRAERGREKGFAFFLYNCFASRGCLRGLHMTSKLDFKSRPDRLATWATPAAPDLTRQQQRDRTALLPERAKPSAPPFTSLRTSSVPSIDST
jgi:hypothetical protein